MIENFTLNTQRKAVLLAMRLLILLCTQTTTMFLMNGANCRHCQLLVQATHMPDHDQHDLDLLLIAVYDVMIKNHTVM